MSLTDKFKLSVIAEPAMCRANLNALWQGICTRNKTMQISPKMGRNPLLDHLSGNPDLLFPGLMPGVIFAAPAVTVESLQIRVDALVASSQSLLDAADGAGRDLTDDEVTQIQDNTAEVERLKVQISARSLAAGPSAGQGNGGAGRRTQPEPQANAGGGNARVPAQARGANAGKGGFLNFGEFALAVKAAGQGPGEQRLQNAATTYGSEAVGADGGFAVPPDYRTQIWTKVMAEENLLTRCSPLVTGSNSIVIPKDETTPWDTSGGVQAYWEAEAAVVAQSKPQLSMSNIRLAKLMALVPISDELLEDAPGMESWLMAKAPQKMTSKINTAIIEGSGVGQPLGILRAACTISIPKESGQPADTVYFGNISKMWAAMYAPCRRNAVWLINQDAEPQLEAMAFDPNATSKVPVYLPTGGLSETPYAIMKGRPVVPVEACQTIGSQGDIILADLTQYWAVTKGTDVKTDVSMHLFFDQGLMAFRFTFRVNGQPAWGSSIAPQHGTMNRSCFVVLDDR